MVVLLEENRKLQARLQALEQHLSPENNLPAPLDLNALQHSNSSSPSDYQIHPDSDSSWEICSLNTDSPNYPFPFDWSNEVLPISLSLNTEALSDELAFDLNSIDQSACAVSPMQQKDLRTLYVFQALLLLCN
jgi:hypothetical protein